MSKHFTVRHPLTVEVGEQKKTFYLRELGYLEIDELRQKALANEGSKESRGNSFMFQVVLACTEEEDGSPSYTQADLRTEIGQVVLPLSKAAMKAQGIDVDKANDEPDITEEEVEGNVEPSRKSGANSPLTSAAQSVKSKAA